MKTRKSNTDSINKPPTQSPNNCTTWVFFSNPGSIRDSDTLMFLGLLKSGTIPSALTFLGFAWHWLLGEESRFSCLIDNVVRLDLSISSCTDAGWTFLSGILHRLFGALLVTSYEEVRDSKVPHSWGSRLRVQPQIALSYVPIYFLTNLLSVSFSETHKIAEWATDCWQVPSKKTTSHKKQISSCFLF